MTVTGAQIVAEVKKFAGDRYVYGGTTPSGFDCSGLVQYVLTQLGMVNVPRTSEAQWAWVQQNNDQISASQLQSGDLVFAQFPGDNASPGHVGIYTGNGQVLSAEDPQLGVGYSSLASWGSNIVGYGRVPTTSGSNSGSGSGSGSDSGLLGDLLGIPSSITSAFQDFDTFINTILWLTKPGNWFRIGAFFAGTTLLLIGIWLLAKAANPDLSMPAIPVPIPV